MPLTLHTHTHAHTLAHSHAHTHIRAHTCTHANTRAHVKQLQRPAEATLGQDEASCPIFLPPSHPGHGAAQTTPVRPQGHLGSHLHPIGSSRSNTMNKTGAIGRHRQELCARDPSEPLPAAGPLHPTPPGRRRGRRLSDLVFRVSTRPGCLPAASDIRSSQPADSRPENQ